MRKNHALLLAALTLTGVAGCQDTWAGFLREERNLKNELADYMIRVTDEKSAEYVVEGPAKKLKDKWEDHKERIEKYVKGQDLGQFDMVLTQLRTRDVAKMGIGKRVRTFTKAADGRITVEGPEAEGSLKEAIDTLTDVEFKKALDAADDRIKEQRSRIGAIQPEGQFLAKAKGLPKAIFNIKD